MLQFIVLGYVPGTSIQLQFEDVLLIVGILLVMLWISGFVLNQILQASYNRLAVNLWPYLRFRRRQDTFTVKLKLL